MKSKKCGPFLWLILALDLHQISSIKLNSGDRTLRDIATTTTEIPETSQEENIMFEQRTEITPDHPCYPFSNPDYEKGQFFSPGYPNNYTNNTDCYLVLKAAPGHLVQLDFRDWFAIEPSADCKNDFLEVRDGPHGYNNLKHDPFCGFDFPDPIISSDRYLWIHFRSDENIEYKGFRAVFKNITRPPSITTPEIKPCIMTTMLLEEGYFGTVNISEEITKMNQEYFLPTDCLWKIVVKEGRKIQLQFQKFSLEKPNDCESNFIQVFSNHTDYPNMDKMFCGSMADTVNSKGNIMYVRYFNGPTRGQSKSVFEANFTEYREVVKAGGSKHDCYPNEFDCDDATCIPISLWCNGKYNCKHRWDEDECTTPPGLSLSEDHIIIIMVIFSLILSGMCFTFIFNCVKKLIRDHKIMQEYISQSREKELNELGKQDQIDEKYGKPLRSGSNSSPSTDSRRFDVANATTTTTPCYVPGGELLPILIRNDHHHHHNREHSLSPSNNGGDTYNNIYTVDNENLPEMCDSACQTRESLFTTQEYSSGNSTPIRSVQTNSPPAPFSTFGYIKDNAFKAEAKIEMTAGILIGTPPPLSSTATTTPSTNYHKDIKKRPYSVQTTKSAPDVIVTH